MVNLGREDALDREGLTRLVASINRYHGVVGEGPDLGVPQVAALVGEELRITGSKPMGTAYLLDGLWRQLGIDTALKRVLGDRRFTTDVERVLFALVANRAIDPLSKLAATEWACEDVLIAGSEELDEDQAYRAMDLLAEAKTAAAVQERCSSRRLACSTSKSMSSSSTPPAPTGNVTAKTHPMRPRVRVGSAATVTPRTTAPTCPRS